MNYNDISVIVSAFFTLASTAAVIANLILFRLNRGKITAETQKLRAEREEERSEEARNYAQIAVQYAEELRKVKEDLRIETQTLRTEIIELRRQLDERDMMILQQKAAIDDLEDWADRLVHQVRSMGSEPVPYRASKKAGEQATNPSGKKPKQGNDKPDRS